jgi:hypothetical protein
LGDDLAAIDVRIWIDLAIGEGVTHKLGVSEGETFSLKMAGLHSFFFEIKEGYFFEVKRLTGYF